jgi:hypothetical protein
MRALLNRHGAPLALLVLVLAQSWVLHGARAGKSPTSDEWSHLTRGLAYWNASDTRLSYAHPPLANALATAFVRFDWQQTGVEEDPTWAEADNPRVADVLLTMDYVEMRRCLLKARRAMALWSLALTIYVYFLVRRYWGAWAAVGAASLVGLNPTLLAHAGYLTTDLPIAVFLVIALGEAARFLEAPGRTRMAVFSLACAGMILTKHSGVVLSVAVVAVVFVGYLRHLWRTESRRGRLVGRLALFLTLFAATQIVCVNAAYRFERTGWTVEEVLAAPEPQYWVSRNNPQQTIESFTPLARLPGALVWPLPYTWTFGVASVGAQNDGGFPYGWFNGKINKLGTWSYFPIMFVIKTPILVLLVGLGGALLALRRVRAAHLLFKITLPVVLMFLVVLLRARLNMGVRHALPLVTAMTLAGIAGLLPWLVQRHARHLAVISIGCLLAMIPVAVLALPDYLGYFNVAAGGRAGGHRISIVGEDWGQDRETLAKLVLEHDLTPLYYDSVTLSRSREMKFLGLHWYELPCEASPKPGSWVAVHRVMLVARPKCYPELRKLTPVYLVNDHIHVYRYESAAEPQPPGEGTAR